MFEGMPLPIDASKESAKNKLERLKSLKKTLGEFEDMRDEELVFRPMSRIGTIVSSESPEKDRIIMAGTDRGVVTKKDQAIATDHLFGCMAILIIGNEHNSITHITPSSNLAWRDTKINDDYTYNPRIPTAEKIIEAFGGNESMKDSQIIILSNMGHAYDGGGFYYKDIQNAQSEFEQLFINAGAKFVRSAELPLDDTLIYYSPENLEMVYALGRPASYNENGSISIDKELILEVTIPISKDTPLPYTINRPSE